MKTSPLKSGSLSTRSGRLTLILILMSGLVLFFTFNAAALEGATGTAGAPTVSNLTPGDGTNISTTSTKISAYITDTDKLNSASATMELDGVAVTPRFKFKGHYEYDSCGGSYWVNDSYLEGTLEYYATNLKDGVHTVRITMADLNGNTLTKEWSFTLGAVPKFSAFAPAQGSLANSISGILISAKATDDTGINADSVVLKVYGSRLDHSFDPATGTISARKALEDGTYTAEVSAADLAGNVGTASWTFRVSTDAAPSVLSLTPSQGGTVTVRNPKITAYVKDTYDDLNNTSVKLKIDGSSVTPKFMFSGHWEYDSCTGEYYVIDSRREGTIEYQPAYLKDGLHTAELSITDKAGNTLTKQWSFTVKTKPTISDAKPVPSYVSTQTPVISALVEDVDPDDGTITMYVDGSQVPAVLDPATGLLSYTPADGLPNEQMHTVRIDASDMGGAASHSWKFYVNTYPDMADSNIDNCSSCHSYDESAAIPFQAMHTGVGFYGSHSDNRCDACHNYITYPADCLQCHGDEGPDGWIDEAPHGSTPGISYRLTQYDTSVPMRVTVNREMWDCVICHQPGSPVLGWEGYLVKPTRQLNNHDIPELHKTTDQACVKCHALSLTREHAREGRLDSANRPISCNTCHRSSDTKVKAAIANNDTSCSACHDNANHESLHNTTLGPDCQSCHDAALSTEHSNKGYSCASCHDNQTGRSQFAIKWSQTTCSDCHRTSNTHKVNFAATVPDSVPLYTSLADGTILEWTAPESLDFWTGESWIPDSMTGGMLTISKRSTALTPAEVFSFYAAKMAELGWDKTAGPDTASDKFELIYTKDSKVVHIRCFGTSSFDSTNTSPYGYKIEIMYK